MHTRSDAAATLALGERAALSVSRVRLGLLAVALAAFVAGSPGLFDESSVSLHGDAARHLMNGVFLADAAHDRPFGSVGEFLEYAQRYYARYPALSLGHHPPLVAVAEAPIFLLFGVSVAAARTVQLASLVAAALLLYLLVQERIGWAAGLAAAGIFVTSPTVVVLSRSVMSEMPALALVLAAAYSLHRFTRTERPAALAAFVLTAALSLYAKQLAVFVFPAFVAMAVGSLGVRRLVRRDVALAAGALALLTVPLALMTLALSPSNVRAAVAVLSERDENTGPWLSVSHALTGQFAWPVLALIAVGTVLAGTQRRPGRLTFAFWAAVALAGMAAVSPWEPARYGVYAVPALAALAGSLAHAWPNRGVSAAATGALALAIGYQATEAADQQLAGAGGYEEAARFVLASKPGPTVLFSGDVDTGYFTFFVRKHDRSRSLVVLRSDKIFTTSYLGNPSHSNRVTSQSAIHERLQQLGVRYVVFEDTPSRSVVLEGLRQDVKSAPFIERLRIPVATTDARLRGADLVVYEYSDATAPAPDAVLSMDLPIIHQSVSVKLSDLIDRKGLRP